MRKRFVMTQEQLDKLLEASKSVPYMVFGGLAPQSPQERANAAWEELGRELGFDYMTVQSTGEGDAVFTAEVTKI